MATARNGQIQVRPMFRFYESESIDLHYEPFLCFGGEWRSGLGLYNENQKVPGSHPTRRSTGLMDPTSF